MFSLELLCKSPYWHAGYWNLATFKWICVWLGYRGVVFPDGPIAATGLAVNDYPGQEELFWTSNNQFS